jgi:hypothetical protein
MHDAQLWRYKVSAMSMSAAAGDVTGFGAVAVFPPDDR